MRRIVMFNRVSADGYFSGPGGELDWAVAEPTLDEAVAGSLGGDGTILFGRRTYDQFESFWPKVVDDSGTAPSPHGEPRRSRELHAMGVWINAATKIVFSRTRKDVTWTGSRLIREFDPREVEALKRGPGKDIMIFGSGSIVSLLTQHDLIDEYQLVIAPLLLGQGRQAIHDVTRRVSLTLVEATPFPRGNVRLRYTRAGS